MIIAYALAAYALIGAAFVIPFLARGLYRIDPATRGTGIGFRLLISPGAVALWPVLLRKWMSTRR